MTSELRHAQKVEARGADAVFSMRESDLPVKAREYARNLHGQVQDIYARLGVASIEEISALPPATLRRRMKDVERLQPLLSRLREALIDPERVERRVDSQRDLEWYEAAADRLATCARDAGKAWIGDPFAGAENAFGTLRYKAVDYPEGDEDVQEEVRENARAMLAELYRLMKQGLLGGKRSLPRLAVCAYDIGEVAWAALFAQDEELTEELNVLAARAKGYARVGNVFYGVAALQECYDAHAGDGSRQREMLHDVAPIVYAAAVKKDDEKFQGDLLALLSHATGEAHEIQTVAFDIFLDERDFTSALRLAEILRDSGRKYEVLAARQDAGEDVTAELAEHLEVQLLEFVEDANVAFAACAGTIKRLRANPDVMQKCFARLVVASLPREGDEEYYVIVRALALGELALAIGEDAAPYLQTLKQSDVLREPVAGDMHAAEYVTLLYAAGQREAALNACATNAPGHLAEACTKLAAAMVRKGDDADVPTLLDRAQEILRQQRDDTTQLDACEVAIAITDQRRADSLLESVDNAFLSQHGEEFVRRLSAAGMSSARVLTALDAHLRGTGAGHADVLKRYIQLSATAGVYSRGFDYVADIDNANVEMGTSVKKMKVVQWLWEGAVDAAEKAKKIRKAGGV